MNVFHAHEFLAVLPRGWKDKTVNIFAQNDSGPSDLNVVVSRERVPRGEPLQRSAEQQIFALMSKLPLFKILKQAPTPMDQESAILLEYTWQSPEGKMHMVQVLARPPETDILLVISASSRNEMSAASRAEFQEFLGNFRFRR